MYLAEDILNENSNVVIYRYAIESSSKYKGDQRDQFTGVPKRMLNMMQFYSKLRSLEKSSFVF